MRSTTTLTMLALSLIAILLVLEIPIAVALERPVGIVATYNAAHDQVVVKWDKVSNAEKYRIVIKTISGATVVRGSTSGLVKSFLGGKFEPFTEYRVLVQSLASGLSSKSTSKRYIHTLSRGAGKGKLFTTNSFGRSGNFYLPANFKKQQMPLMVGLHGQGGAGDSMVNAFANYAEKFGFIIVAPSSGLFHDGTAAWEIELAGAPTADFNHIQDCIAEVRAFVDVQIDTRRVIAVGYSAGGGVAPYIATNSANIEFTHFAVLHGGIVLDTFGPRVIPAWLSTGVRDPLRPPSELLGYQTMLQALGFDTRYTEYDTDHGLTRDELRGVIGWWLDK